eukprot:scaffold55435_cov24-Tisochrysis_lutea.AAC.3
MVPLCGWPANQWPGPSSWAAWSSYSMEAHGLLHKGAAGNLQWRLIFTPRKHSQEQKRVCCPKLIQTSCCPGAWIMSLDVTCNQIVTAVASAYVAQAVPRSLECSRRLSSAVACKEGSKCFMLTALLLPTTNQLIATSVFLP